MVPVLASLPRALSRLARVYARVRRPPVAELLQVRGGRRYPAAWFPLASMRLAASLHRRRAAEFSPCSFTPRSLNRGPAGSSPRKEAVGRLVAKLRAFLTWLAQSGPLSG